MKSLSLEPDDHMKWIYDPSHEDYHSEHAEWLRNKRAAAIRSAPEWMVRESQLNDIWKKRAEKAEK